MTPTGRYTPARLGVAWAVRGSDESPAGLTWSSVLTHSRCSCAHFEVYTPPCAPSAVSPRARWATASVAVLQLQPLSQRNPAASFSVHAASSAAPSAWTSVAVAGVSALPIPAPN